MYNLTVMHLGLKTAPNRLEYPHMQGWCTRPPPPKKKVQFKYLETCGVRKWWKAKKREAHGMRLDPALCHEMSVKNIGPKCIGH